VGYDIDDEAASLEVQVDSTGERVGDSACYDNDIGTGAAARFSSPPLPLGVPGLRIDYSADGTGDYECDNGGTDGAVL
jgi:hypothetical protein